MARASADGSAKGADRRRVGRILDRLDAVFAGRGIELSASSPWELLVATILSAQCTDQRVNQVTPELFQRFRTPEEFAAADQSEVERLIKPTGFFRAKARNLIACGRALTERFGGRVPRSMEELVTLPGVGRKTANVLLGEAFGEPSIVVDTHVKRVAGRLGLVASDDPVKIERALQRVIPNARWSSGSRHLLLHGRYVCVARRPCCEQCALYDLCASREKRPRSDERAVPRRGRPAATRGGLRVSGIRRASDETVGLVLCEMLRLFYDKGWVAGTGGGICAGLEDGTLLMAPTGVHKERVTADDLFRVDRRGAVVSPPENPGLRLTECSTIFCAIAEQRRAGSVMHSHGLSAVLAADLAAGGDRVMIRDLEMLKGIRGCANSDVHAVPVVDNTAREAELAEGVRRVIQAPEFARAACVLVRHHGAYIWGEDVWEVKRHAEVYHFLFEAIVARTRGR